ncbi:cadmium resistance transporter [Geminocystis sp. NIES-3709]|uniref:cadmium resistance transporter n=1 Tax=Geminocystis sp. NIES-3709 TaxID=1617448 RepID=UPI0005FC8E76|nr:cadmium resistance transporter [Geminocystis sp. NIES-3709]BAQ64780.1 cadmium resistance transporter [Geminocystis sp. NIES-3709]
MTDFITAIIKAIATFTVTNLDDIMILTLFFAQVNVLFRRRQIIMGQYLGFILLVLASLPGFFGTFFLPTHFLKSLGVIPVILGIIYLYNMGQSDSDKTENLSINHDNSNWLTRFLSPQVYGVAAVTIANGSDNISVYLPLFASTTVQDLLITVITFFVLVAVWCLIAYKLTNINAISDLLTSYGNSLVPCVLIGLGVYIVQENLWLSSLALIVSYLWAINLEQNRLSEED